MSQIKGSSGHASQELFNRVDEFNAPEDCGTSLQTHIKASVDKISRSNSTEMGKRNMKIIWNFLRSLKTMVLLKVSSCPLSRSSKCYSRNAICFSSHLSHLRTLGDCQIAWKLLLMHITFLKEYFESWQKRQLDTFRRTIVFKLLKRLLVIFIYPSYFPSSCQSILNVICHTLQVPLSTTFRLIKFIDAIKKFLTCRPRCYCSLSFILWHGKQ